jgi:hypothetical protein
MNTSVPGVPWSGCCTQRTHRSLNRSRPSILVLVSSMSAIAELTLQVNPYSPLTAANGELYVDWQKTLGGDNVKLRLSREIVRRCGQPAVHLLTGLYGTGKTTELYRVKNLVEAGIDGRKFFVSMLEAEKSLPLSDVRAELLMYQVISQLVTDLQEAGFRACDQVLTFFKSLQREFKRKLKIDAIEIDGNGLVKFRLRFQDIAGDLRQDYQRLLQGNLPSMHDMANNHLIIEARAWLAKQGKADDILIVVDELDRMSIYTSSERLFIDGASWLRALGCHLLYTIPLDLYYSKLQRQLHDLYGTETMILPVMPVHDRAAAARPAWISARSSKTRLYCARSWLSPAAMSERFCGCCDRCSIAVRICP